MVLQEHSFVEKFPQWKAIVPDAICNCLILDSRGKPSISKRGLSSEVTNSCTYGCGEEFSLKKAFSNKISFADSNCK
jgi:hypothetical protein